MRRIGRPLLPLLLSVAAGLSLSCKDSTSPGPQVASLDVTPGAITLPQKGEQVIAVAALDQDGLLLTGVSIKFTSNDPEMLEVTATGRVKAIGRAGSYYVRVSAGRVVEDVPVTVTPVIVGIEVTPSSVTVPRGGEVQLSPALRDINGFAVEDVTFDYHVESPLLISISPTGLLRPVGPRGNGTFAVTSADGAWWTRVQVTVTGVPTTLAIAPNPLSIAQGGTFQLQPVVLDAYGDAINGQTATFSGGAAGIGSVSATGLVTAGQTLGSFTVTATSGSLTAQSTVNVVEPGEVERPNGTLTHTVDVGPEGYGVAAAGGIAYVARLGGGLSRVDLGSFTSLGTIAGYFADVRVNEAGTMAYAAGGRSLSFIDLSTNTVAKTVDLDGGDVWSVELSEDESRVFVGGAGTVWVVDAETGTVLKTLSGIGDMNHLHRAPLSGFIYASSFTNGVVKEIDPGTMSVTRSFTVPGGAQGAAASPDGATLYVAQEGTAQVAAVDLATGDVRYSAGTGVAGFGLTLTKDGTQVYMGGGGSVVILDAASLSVLSTISYPTGGIRRLASSVDGAMVLVAGGTSLGVIE